MRKKNPAKQPTTSTEEAKLSQAAKLQIAGVAAPNLRAKNRISRRVHLVGVDGKVTRTVTTEDLQQALLKRAKIEFDTATATAVECLRCGKMFIRPEKGSQRARKYCDRCKTRRGNDCVSCGKPVRGYSKTARQGSGRRCAECVRKERAAGVSVCVACGARFTHIKKGGTVSRRKRCEKCHSLWTSPAARAERKKEERKRASAAQLARYYKKKASDPDAVRKAWRENYKRLSPEALENVRAKARERSRRLWAQRKAARMAKKSQEAE